MWVNLTQGLVDLPDYAIIAIYGVDGAGKTTLVDQLAPMIMR